MKPSVLITTTSRWFPTARLAAALVRAGCHVDAACPLGHPLVKLKNFGKTYPYRGLTPLHAFSVAIRSSRPDLIVPGDDLATSHLHRLYEIESRRGESGRQICRLIERSLGSSESFPVAYARAGFIQVAKQAGVRAPKTAAIANLDQLRKWVASAGLPTVLKADGTSGGEGVRVVHTLAEAEQAFRTLQAPPLVLRALKRAVVNRDKTLLSPAMLRRRSVVNAQEFVPGREATSAVACWQGKVLASLHFEVIHKRDAAGPSSVLRLIEHGEIAATAETMVSELKLSGLVGFDFMLEASTGDAHLIEINPRATQVGHLTLGPGRDLPAALYAVLSGEEIKLAPKLTESDTIALFPQEWMRDPGSPFLQSAYHDVPWGDPELLAHFAGIRPQKNSLDTAQTAIPNFSPARLPRL